MAPTALRSGAQAAGSPFASRPTQASKGPSSSKNGSGLFGNNGSTLPNGFGDEAGDAECSTTYLEPVTYTRGGKEKWKQAGRTTGIAVSPVGGETAAWVASQDPESAVKATSKSDKVVYFASPYSYPDPVINFYAETYTLFTSLQRIVASSFKISSPDAAGFDVVEKLLGPAGAETIGHMSRISILYLDEVAKLRDTLQPGALRTRYDAVYQVLHLTQILFLPRDGRGEGLLGEELLDWVNEVDPAPDNSLGNEIMQTSPPWDHPAFWPYLTRCILRGFLLPASTFLRSLNNHPHPPIQNLANLLSGHLAKFPRSSDTTAYPLDHEFIEAHRQWLLHLRAELATLGRKGKWIEGKEWEGWDSDFKTVIELLEGKAETVFEEASDWREAVGAWGLLVDVGLRRDDLPAVAARILERIPVESGVLDDAIQSSLCAGDIVKVLTSSYELDIWLAAHLGDIFDKLSLLPDEDRFDMSLRDYFILEYADCLAEQPKHASTWRLVADYLSTAGPEGRNRLKEFIVHVGLTTTVDEAPAGDEDMDVETVDPRFRHFAELCEVCLDLGLDEQWKTISQVMADRLVRKAEYGIAATMYVHADDAYGLSRLAETVLSTYVSEGEESFLNYVSALPPSILNVPIEVDDEKPPAYNPRLAFLAQFRDFVLFRQQGVVDRASDRLVSLISADIAPTAFRAVLLADSIRLLEDAQLLVSSANTFEIMRVLEDVKTHAAFAPEVYLGQLAVYLERNGQKGGIDGATRKIEEVRLALARNLARALVVDMNESF